MLKFLLAALLVAAAPLAFAANPTAVLNVQVVPATVGIPCALGPNAPAIPGPAAAFGFDTCINFDFSYTGTFVYNGNTYQWSNMASWLNTAGASSPLFTQTAGNNNNVWQIGIDPASGLQALRVQVPAADTPITFASQINTIQFPTTNAFIEEVVRVDPTSYVGATAASNNELIDDFGFFSGGGGRGLETDSGFTCITNPSTWMSGEPCSGNGAFVWAPAGLSGQPSFGPASGISLIDGHYHTTGMLTVASRTSGQLGYCGYYDGQFAAPGAGGGSCFNPYDNAPGGTGQQVCAIVPSACSQMGTNSIGSFVTNATQDTALHWVLKLRIWTCAGWNTPSGGAGNNCDSGGHTIPGDGDNGPSY